MNKFLAGLVFLIFAVLGIALLKQCNTNDPIDDPKVQAEFKRREMEFNKKLDSRDSARKILELRVDYLTARADSLERVDSTHVSALLLIKGKFSKLSSKELKDKMIEEYNNRTR